jgi:Putative adhesin
MFEGPMDLPAKEAAVKEVAVTSTMPNTLTLDRRRRRALVIGVPVAFILIAYGALLYVGLIGQDNFRVQTSVTPVGGKVSMSVGSGDISVVPSGSDQAHVSGVVSFSLFRPSVRWQTTPNGTALDGPGCNWLGNCSAQLTVALPAGVDVNASSGSGDVEASNLGGAALTLQSGSGDVSVKRAAGPLDLSAGSGDITGTGLSGPKVKANDGSGDVSLSFTRPPNEVTVSAGSGDIRVELPTNVSYKVDVSTPSGTPDIGVPTDSSSPHVIRLVAYSGDVYVVPYRP